MPELMLQSEPEDQPESEAPTHTDRPAKRPYHSDRKRQQVDRDRIDGARLAKAQQAGLAERHLTAVARSTSTQRAIFLAGITLSQIVKQSHAHMHATTTWEGSFVHGQYKLTATADQKRAAARAVLDELRELVHGVVDSKEDAGDPADPEGGRGGPELPPLQAATAESGAGRAAPPPKRHRGSGVQRRDTEQRHVEFRRTALSTAAERGFFPPADALRPLAQTSREHQEKMARAPPTVAWYQCTSGYQQGAPKDDVNVCAFSFATVKRAKRQRFESDPAMASANGDNDAGRMFLAPELF
eukprot:SAG31_NODE_6868_length_1865_cov_7.847678_1_plen_298_part_10